VSTNYGVVPSKEALRGIGAVIGCYGARDGSMARSPERLERRLQAIGHEPAEIHVLDAGHSFLTDAQYGWVQRHLPMMALGDYPHEREEGWQKIFAFFDAHL
jgi:carboxymethylenebutenolidase